MWITCAPLAWLLVVTFAGGWEKIFSPDPRIGFLAQAGQLSAAIAAGRIPAARIAETRTLIFNAQLDAAVCAAFVAMVALIFVDSVRVWIGVLRGTREARVEEAPFVMSQLRVEEI